jgi:hypothetical protein
MAGGRLPLDRGDFVWTHFPSSEHPTEPSGQRHIALCLRSTSHANGSHVLLAVYTTTKKPADRPKARGEIDVPDERAHEYGQTSGFRINVKRIAALPNCRLFPGPGETRSRKAGQFRTSGECL